MDLSLVISRLKKFDLHEYNTERPIIFVEAKSPDDACHQAYYRLATVIFIEDILLDISITKVDTPK